MAHDGNGWSNDFNDINNLNKTLGAKDKQSQNRQQKEERFIDKFYPFVHTARIEQLYVMEITQNELPKNLVTSGERAEYIEIGVRYGFKEAAFVVGLFLFGVIAQFAAVLKNPTPLTDVLDVWVWISLFVTVIYGLSYSLHISKYCIGTLTSKVINALLAGRLMILLIVATVNGWALWAFQDYIYSHTNDILTVADNIVPDKDGGMYGFVSNIFDYIMTPFGGTFVVTEDSVAYAMAVVIPELLGAWWKIAIAMAVSMFIPIVLASYKNNTTENESKQAKTELENY